MIKGMPRDKVKALGEALEEGEAALVLISRAPVSPILDGALTRVDGRVEERLGISADDVVDLIAV